MNNKNERNKITKLIIGGIYLIFSYIIFFLMCEKLSFVHFSYDLLFLFSIFNVYVFCHFLFDIKIMYNFIYKYRYILGIILLSILVVFKYNGSSIGMWNSYVQPEYQLDNDVVFGIARGIRSDEWLVSTPVSLTQATEEVNYSSINNLLAARDNLVTFYPNLPSKDISILSTPNNIGFLFLDTERAFSLSWYLPYFVLFFATFELIMILTKKNKLYSLVGAIMITLSPVIQWWDSPYIPAYGALAVTLFYYLINSTSKIKKLLISILFGYSGYIYIMCMYPAWQVVYAYVYLIMLIWIIAKNKEKIHKIDFIYLIPSILTLALPLVYLLKENYDVLTIVNSTVYPGARMSTGGGEWRTLFTYILDIFFPFTKGFSNPCEFSQYTSLFPIPIVYSIYLMVKNRKKDLFLILSDILLVCLLIWVVFPLPAFISKLTLIFMSTENRVQVAIGYLSIIEMMYILSNYEIKIKEKKYFNYKNFVIVLLSIIYIFTTIKISNGLIREIYPYYINIKTTILSIIIFLPVVCLFIYNHKKTNYILSLLFICISIICGIIVSPLNKGLGVMYSKPIGKEIKQLVNDNSDSVFIVADGGIALQNYIAVNGAKTVNTINHVPNLTLYHKLDPELDYDNIYNRYHHLSVNIVEEKTNFSLIQADAITLNLNVDDICITKANYIVTNGENKIISSRFNNIYHEYNVNIYKTNCK